MAFLGRDRLVDDLAADDFGEFRLSLTLTVAGLGPVAISTPAFPDRPYARSSSGVSFADCRRRVQVQLHRRHDTAVGAVRHMLRRRHGVCPEIRATHPKRRPDRCSSWRQQGSPCSFSEFARKNGHAGGTKPSHESRGVLAPKGVPARSVDLPGKTSGPPLQAGFVSTVPVFA